MKFALLGIDAEALQLVREIARSDAHVLQYFILGLPPGGAPPKEVEPLVAEVLQLCPLAAEPSGWESLLEPGYCDAVIVSGPPAGRFDQLRRLVQEAVPVIVTHPPPVTLLEAYELEMVRQETRCPVFSLLLPWPKHIWDERGLPRVADAHNAGSSPGRIEQVTWQRRLVDRRRETVLAHLARDIDFIRSWCGEITQVATLGGMTQGTGGLPRDCSALAVQMTGSAQVLVRWSVEPADGAPGVTIAIAGRAARHRVEIVEANEPAERRIQYAILKPSGGDAAVDEIEGVPSRLEAAVAPFQAWKESGQFNSNWPEAIRSLELVEAVEKSLKKGRTISVGVEGRTEADAFKGTMASLGCALLMLGLVVVLFSAVMLKIAQKTDSPLLVSIFKWWPAALIALFVVFLLLQFFRFIIPKDASKDPKS